MAAVAYVRPLTPLGFEQPTGRDLLFWRNRLELDAANERKQTLLCFTVGLALNALVVGISVFAARFLQRLRPATASPISLKEACIVALIACGIMFLFAAITKPASRADCANAFLEGHRSSSGGAESLVILLILLIALYGSFCLVETGTRLWLQFRLRRCDTDELARLMATISHAPTGVRLNFLRKHGQDNASLRRAVAMLILTGWVKPVQGDVVTQCSSAMRNCIRRHPLADVFQPGE